jgi:hypothetical protein
MKRFNRVGIVYIWLFVAGIFICFSCSAVTARESQPAYVSPIDGMVGGEPGEDPHLRITPDTKIELIWYPAGSGGYGSMGHTEIGGSEVCLVADPEAPGGTVCRTCWRRMFIFMLSRVLSP